jgi:hypothetical protein
MKSDVVAFLTICAVFGMLLSESAIPVRGGAQQDAESVEILQSPSTQMLVGHANHLLMKLANVSKELGMKFLGPDYFLPDWATPRDDEDDPFHATINGKTIEYRSAAYWITFRLQDHSLVGFYNPQITIFEDGPNAPLYYPSDSPTWSVEKAMTMATAFRNAFVDITQVKLGPAQARYDHTSYALEKLPSGKQISKAHLGSWDVSWPRLDHSGHRFYGDGVTIVLSEKYGLSGANISMATPFEERSGKALTKSEALKRARAHIAGVFGLGRWCASFASNDPYETIIGDDLESADLMVMVPNHIWSWNPFSSGKPKPEGRLVWDFWFKPIHKALPRGPTYDDRFAVWVDAYSGEIVGGDAML